MIFTVLSYLRLTFFGEEMSVRLYVNDESYKDRCQRKLDEGKYKKVIPEKDTFLQFLKVIYLQ